MLKNSLFQPSLSFSLSAAILFLFLFLFSTLLLCSSPLFLFFLCVALYFSAQNTSFSAQTFFSPQILFSVQPNFFFFSVQPLFSSSFFCFILFWFSLLFFLFQRLLFFFSLALFIQDPIFSLVASHLFYLNKSLFSSNLE